jgi:Ca-activated chloride channel family protein
LPKTELDGYATNNLVFLIDISSSMNSPEKMPLLKESMKYLVSELRETDRVAILTFSKYVKEVLPSTAAANKNSIYKIIDELTFGSTSQGGAALEVAYKAASKNFVQKGNNRIVLASDGVFTSGESDYKKMQQLIESGLDKNISLSIFCFGKNTEYVKIKLKKLTSAGNGNFATITTIEEAKQRMMEEAKAVKE